MQNKYNRKLDKNLLIKLRPGFISKKNYIISVTSIPRPSHEIFPLVEYENKKGILLIKRKIAPAEGIIWCFGGRQQRGYLLRDSLIRLVKKECNLQLYDITCLGEPQDLFWDEDPFGHNKGTHDLSVPYFARTKGKLKLDKFHSDPLIITPEYFLKMKNNLHWYIKENTEKALNIAFN